MRPSYFQGNEVRHNPQRAARTLCHLVDEIASARAAEPAVRFPVIVEEPQDRICVLQQPPRVCCLLAVNVGKKELTAGLG